MSLAALLAACLWLLLATSALHKLTDRERTRAATVRLLAMPHNRAVFAWFTALAIEIAAAVAILIPGLLTAGAALAALLWLAYAGAALAAWRRGENRLDCGCSWGGKPHDSNVRLVAARAAALALLAALLAAVSGDPPWRDPLAVASAFGLLALGFAASQISRNLMSQGGLSA